MSSSRKQFGVSINSESSTKSIISISNSYSILPSISSLSIEEISNIGSHDSKSSNNSVGTDKTTDIAFNACKCNLM